MTPNTIGSGWVFAWDLRNQWVLGVRRGSSSARSALAGAGTRAGADTRAGGGTRAGGTNPVRAQAGPA
ncbi:MAG: hypothetical protein ACLQB1_10865 [Streptosporangiaceae bacterium]